MTLHTATRDSMAAAERTLVSLLAVSIFLNYVDRSNLSLAAPLLQTQFSLSPSAVGSLFSAFFWTYALLQLFGFAGWLADHYPPGIVLAGGLFVWSAATVATGMLSTLPALFVARLLVGAGESVAYPCYSRIFASALPAERRGFANALLDAASKLGPALGTVAGGLLLARFGWRNFFIILGLLSLLWLPPWLRLMPRGFAAHDVAMWRPSTLDILRSRSAWGAFLGHFCGNYFWFFLLTWLPTYLVNERGFPMAAMVEITSAAFFLIAGSTIAAGWISDRWIASGATPTRVRKTIVVCGLGCSTLILPVAAIHNRTAATLLLLLACMAFGTYTSNHWAITQTLAGPLAAGRWTSLQNGTGNIAGAAASWLTGVAVEHSRSFVSAFAVAGVIAFTGAILWGAVVQNVEQVEWRKGGATP